MGHEHSRCVVAEVKASSNLPGQSTSFVDPEDGLVRVNSLRTGLIGGQTRMRCASEVQQAMAETALVTAPGLVFYFILFLL